MSFRGRTMLLAGILALVPFVLFGVAVMTGVRGSLLEKSRVEHRAILTGILQQIRGTLDGYEAGLRHLARDQRIQSMREGPVHEALEEFHRFNDFFMSSYVYDGTGTIRYVGPYKKYPRGSRRVGKTAKSIGVRLAATIDKVLTSGEPAYYDFVADDETRSYLLCMAAIPPFTGEGKIDGVVSAAIQLYGQQFQELLDPVDLQGNGYCLILDRRGRVIARKGKGLPSTLRAVTFKGFKPGEKGEVNTVIARVGSREDLVSVARLPALGCSVVVGNPKAEVLAYMRVLMTKIVVVGLVALLLGVVCALSLSQSILKPILSLTEGIRKVGEGATGHRLPVEGRDELAQASEAFNRMAAYLQKSRLMERIWKDKWGAKD